MLLGQFGGSTWYVPGGEKLGSITARFEPCPPPIFPVPEAARKTDFEYTPAHTQLASVWGECYNRLVVFSGN